MIPVPKPKFFERKLPVGQSEDDYFDEIDARQTHILRDAIDRVSLARFSLESSDYVLLAYLSVCNGSCWYFDASVRQNLF